MPSKARSSRAASGNSSKGPDPEKRIELDKAPARCDMPRCDNLAAACCNGKCWMCSALAYEKERQ